MDNKLYIISPPKIELDSFKNSLNEAFADAQIACFQLRLKDVADGLILQAAEELIPICHKNNCMFILNDRPDLALISGADGVHIGDEDTPIKEAREILGSEKIIGASCYDSTDYAISCAEAGADYVAFGAFYPTTTKIAKGKPKPEILKWWSENSVIPCVAIGGINEDNCKILLENGADFIAVVSAIWGSNKGPRRAAADLASIVNSYNS